MRIDRRNFMRAFGLAASGLFVPGTLLAVPPFRRVIRPDYSWMYRGLVGWWPLDNRLGPGGTAKDWSNSRNNGSPQGGIVIGGATDQRGQAGRATGFNGSSNYVDLGNTLKFQKAHTDTFSVVVWFKNTLDIVQSSLDLRTLISQRTNATQNGWGLNFGFFTGSPFNSRILTSGTFWGGLQTYVVYTPPTGVWVHLVWVNNGNSTGSIYINGVSQPVAYSGSGSTKDTNDNLVIGRDGSYSNRYDYHNGPISGVRIYNSALLAAEAKNLYNLERVFPYTEFLP